MSCCVKDNSRCITVTAAVTVIAGFSRLNIVKKDQIKILNKGFKCMDKNYREEKSSWLHSPSRTYKFLFGLKLSKTLILINQIENGVMFSL